LEALSVRAPIFQVDAFTTRRFAGNPAAVVPMEHFPADSVLQVIAAENNLAEAAFLVPAGDANSAHDGAAAVGFYWWTGPR
jgi:PhzF family phenazine biosynthesis protein